MRSEDKRQCPKHYVSVIRINGLWGAKNFVIPLNRGVNFLIGPNGTGKTTIINLLSSILRGDFRALFEIHFSKIIIELRSIDNQDEPSFYIAAERANKNNKTDDMVILNIIESGKIEPTISENISLASESSQTPPWRLGAAWTNTTQDSIVSSKLRNFLDSLCHTTWLSIHRSELKAKLFGENQSDSAVERHLADLQQRFRAYNAERSEMVKKEVKDFEKNIFLSLTGGGGFPKFTSDFTNNISIPKYRDVIKRVLASLDIPHRRYEKNFDEFFRKAEISLSKIQAKQGSANLEIEDFFVLSSLLQAERIGEHWVEYQSRIDKINRAKTIFLSITSDYLQPKKSYISNDGGLIFYRFWESEEDLKGDSKPIILPTSQLSSGEKQMVIFLLETLLQDGKPYIFIADEPEISLHVIWQEKLINAILTLNPSSQIIFATHSPDIVSEYADCTINMQEYSQNA